MSVVLPDNAYFRIMSKSGYYLYAQTQLDAADPNDPLIAQSKTSPLDPDNQLFSVRSARSWVGGNGYFTIQGKLSRKSISLDNTNRTPTFLRQTGNVPTNDNFVRLLPHPTDRSLVRIVGSSYAVTASGGSFPGLHLVPITNGITEEQYFQFIMEDVFFRSINFQYQNRKEVRRTPLQGTGQTKTNTSTSTETWSLTLDNEISHMSKFDYLDGYTLKAGFNIELSLEKYIKGSVNGEKSMTTTWTLGQQTTQRVLYRPVFNIQVPPKTTKTAIADVSLIDYEIPYTIVLIIVRNNASITMNGIWRGQLWDVNIREF